MKKILLVSTLLIISNISVAGNERLNVFTCEPEWAALAYAIGGDLLEIESATTHMQDPHHVQARPSLIAKTRVADLLICSGAGLEEGWLPLLLRKSANAKIQPGTDGYFMATEKVELLGKVGKVDRSQGDVHGGGNPHIHFDPRRIEKVADALMVTLSNLQPENQQTFESNLAAFKTALHEMLNYKAGLIEKVKGKAIVVHHDSWPYLFDWLALEKVAELEPKPGLPPSTSHLSSLLEQLSDKKIELIIYSSYQDSKPALWLSGRTNVPALGLPYSVQEWKKENALIEFYVDILQKITSATEK